ncbi:MAG: 30S ribosomal protein S20 [Pirellulales bacterium]
MAHTKSAKKRHKQSEANRAKNRAVKSSLKTIGKKVREAAASGNVEAAEATFRAATAKLDRAASKGVIHANAAARTKSRLSAAIKKSKGK